ncbi:hypothetical protein GGF46_004151 [Coemansia sp. RSA 552]|nr:hypothetical protein GGF46_004151 [Coemansia sp. RSA 552]
MPSSDDASERTLSGDGRASTDTTGLYNVLGVDRDATPDELKRAYRRLALRHHPDRNLGAAGSSGEFVRVQYAYDVLSDERCRRIYNRYGEIGVQMAERMGGELLDPLVSGLLSTFAYTSAVAALLLIAFFALLARRVDRVISWPFSVIFVPLWTVDLVVLVACAWALLGSLALRRAHAERHAAGTDVASCSEEEEEAEAGDGSYSSMPARPAAPAQPAQAATDATPLLHAEQSSEAAPRRQRSSHRSQQRLRRIRKYAEARVSQMATAAPTVYILLLVWFQISLVLRLDGHVGWTALQVAFPWFAIEGIHFVLLTLQLLAGILRIREQALAAGGRPPVAKRMCVLAASTYWWLAIRVSLGVLVVGKLSGVLGTWSWAAVFIPAYLPAVWWFVALCLLRKQLRAMGGDDSDLSRNENAIVLASVIAFGVVTTFVYSFVALLAWKLSQPPAVRLALVLIPVFVALSVACCCCSCFGLCLTYGIDATLESEAVAGQQQRQPSNPTPVPSNRRIAHACHPTSSAEE